MMTSCVLLLSAIIVYTSSITLLHTQKKIIQFQNCTTHIHHRHPTRHLRIQHLFTYYNHFVDSILALLHSNTHSVFTFYYTTFFLNFIFSFLLLLLFSFMNIVFILFLYVQCWCSLTPFSIFNFFLAFFYC